MIQRIAVLLIVCALYCMEVIGQPFYFRHYEVEDGLSNNTVITALQDKYGFIWMGTSEGLNRFDGYGFKVYKHRQEDLKSIKSNAIYCLYEDSKGKLWIGTEKGISVYDPREDDFEQPIPTSNATVRSICEDDDNLLWFILKDELYCFDLKKRVISKKNIPGVKYVSVIYKDAEEGMWIGSLDGKVVYLYKNKAVIYNISASPINVIQAIHGFSNNQLFIGSSQEGLVSLNPINNSIKHLIKEKNGAARIFVRNILKVNDSSFFVTSENGLYIYNPTNGTCQHIVKSPFDPFSISDNALYALCKDKEGGVWIGSYFGGVNYLPHSSLFFEKYISTSNANSLSGNAVREMTKDYFGNLWIGSEDGGLTKLNMATNIFEKYKPNQSNRLASSNIHGLLATGNDLLIGTFQAGLDIMDIKSGKVTKHYNAGNDAYDLKSNFINKICQRSNGEIWICTANNVCRFDRKNGRFYHNHELPANVFYSAITEDSNSTLWIGTHNKGLFYIDKTGTHKLILRSDKRNMLANTRILYLMPDAHNRLWACTTDGLYCIHLNTLSLKHYAGEQGLPSDVVYAIVKDESGHYWISTSQGLAYFDPTTESIRVFRQNNGILNNQFNYQSVYKNENGDIYFGSIKGLIKFNPGSFHGDQYIPPLYITDIQLPVDNPKLQTGFNKDIPLFSKNQIELTHEQATFNIEFSALEFTDPTNILYAYKINNSNWYQIGNTRKIAFTNLSAGDYQITIRSTNGAGYWMANEKSISVRILPPFWKSTAAYVLYIAVITTAMLFIFRYYANRQKEQQRYKMHIYTLNKDKELYQAKIDFFTNITHEIKTPLTLIKLPLERLTEVLDDMPHLNQYLQIMNTNTERLLTLTRQLLDFRKIETENYTLYLLPTNIVFLTKETLDTFASAIAQKNIDVNFTSPNGQIIITCDKEAFIKIVSNLIDNAIKYCNKQVNISFEKDIPEKLVRLIIENDGPLIPEPVRNHIFEPFFRDNHTGIPGSGIGLSLANSLTELHNGHLNYTIKNNINTFTVAFPMNTNTIQEKL